ncbi:MAG TPA: [Fe-S]-binding protein [Paenibacillaceae bacterium]|nr:[Fe-S]-binding protein [Paenibacillaceae bacterium]
MKLVIAYTVFQSPIGPLTLASTTNGLCRVEFGSGQLVQSSLTRWAKKWLLTDKLSYEPKLFTDIVQQLEEYFSGQRKSFSIPLDLFGTSFQKMVWNELLKIPYGETRSYKDIALGLNAAKAVRAVGCANNQNPLSIFIPCHRVIGSNGALVGYGGGLELKEYLLQLEGALEKAGA